MGRERYWDGDAWTEESRPWKGGPSTSPSAPHLRGTDPSTPHPEASPPPPPQPKAESPSRFRPWPSAGASQARTRAAHWTPPPSPPQDEPPPVVPRPMPAPEDESPPVEEAPPPPRPRPGKVRESASTGAWEITWPSTSPDETGTAADTADAATARWDGPARAREQARPAPEEEALEEDAPEEVVLEDDPPPVVLTKDAPSERRMAREDMERLAERTFPVGLAVLLSAEALAAVIAAVLLNRPLPLGLALLPLTIWAVVTVLMLLPVSMRRLSGHRAPNEEERAVLGKPWREVLRTAGLHPRAYHLLVTDSEELNACAPLWRCVAVTSHSAGALPPDRLTAVLAHELGHVHGRRTLLAFVHAQLTLPSRALLWSLRTLWSPVMPMWKRAVAWHRPIGFLLVGLLALAAAAATLIVALPTAVACGAALLARAIAVRPEAGADAVAADLGLGTELLAALDERVEQAEHELPLPLVHRARKLRRLV